MIQEIPDQPRMARIPVRGDSSNIGIFRIYPWGGSGMGRMIPEERRIGGEEATILQRILIQYIR
jgi:hypothetical protein